MHYPHSFLICVWGRLSGALKQTQKQHSIRQGNACYVQTCGTSGTCSETRCGNSRRYDTTNIALQIGLTINVSRNKYVIDRKEKRNEPEERGTNVQW
jgi:hypothetical protein